MNFDIDPRELNLQGPDGMQLVKLLRRLVGSIDSSEGGGGGDEPVENDEIFWCEYNVTTVSEIIAALNNNQLPVTTYNGNVYVLNKVIGTTCYFASVAFSANNPAFNYIIVSPQSWSRASDYLQARLTYDYTPTQGSLNPVTSGGVYTAIQNIAIDQSDIQTAVDQWLNEHSSTIGGLSYEAKQALMDCFANVAWIDDDGQDYYDALYNALFGSTPVTPTLDSISAVFNQGQNVIYEDASLDSLKQYLTVTAHYSDNTSAVVTNYQLSGTLTAGNSTVTVTYQNKTTTFTVVVTARATVTSIDAVFTQGSAVIYDTDSLDTLKQYLTVTANYSDSTTATVTDYTLSGTLTVGTSTITVSYGGKTDTFDVNVVENPFVSNGIYTPIEIVRGQYIENTGEVLSATDESGFFAEFIPLGTYKYLLKYTNAVSNDGDVNWRVSEYDQNKNFIKQTQYKNATTPARQVIIPSGTNTRFIRLGWYQHEGTSFTPVFDFTKEVPTNLVMEVGNIDASGNNDDATTVRIRSVDYIPVENFISTLGCPFADSWRTWNIDGNSAGYAFRCYDSNKSFVGSLLDGGQLIKDDIICRKLPSGTAYVRIIMQHGLDAFSVGFSQSAINTMLINSFEFTITEAS